MRWMRDIVALIGAAALGGGYLYVERTKKANEAVVTRTSADLRRMELEVKYRAASKSAELNARGWPVTIDPAWFENSAPDNTLVDSDRPWVEVAGMSQAELTHPPVRMTVDNSLASFWYNPYQGIVRARVPVMVSDEDATALYNRVNGTYLASIFIRENPPPSMTSQGATPTKPAGESSPAPKEAQAKQDEPTSKGASLFSLIRADFKKPHKGK